MVQSGQHQCQWEKSKVGVFAGPDISESGLVLALDGANYKSFKGEATTNEIVAVTWNGDGSNQASFVKESVLISDENLKYKGYETYLWSPGTSLNCYLHGGDVSSSRTSTVWTFSCYIKREDGGPITSLNVYMYYPSSDGSGNGTIQNVGDGWYRVSRTRTGTDSYISLAGFTGFASGYKYYLSGAQLEKKSYPTTVVATNTTRGTTVVAGGGWADLSGNVNHGELVNGVRENSDNLGSLLFDGSDDFINLGANARLQSIGSNATIECWFKSTDVGSSRYGILVGWGDGNSYYSNFGIGNWGSFSSSESIYLGYNSDVQCYVNETSSTYHDGNWHHAVVTIGSNNHKIFVDGVQKSLVFYRSNSYSVSNVFGYSAGTTINIGSRPYGGGSGYFQGHIPTVKIYNRALTATEIQQNFNANRSRFGI